MRKPNGYGTIKKLSGQRRRPYVFCVSKDGKQVTVAYFATVVEAEIYQADYYKEHQGKTLPARKITFLELYRRWLPAHLNAYPNLSQSTLTSYANACKHCQSLYLKEFAKLKYVDYQQIIDTMRRKGLSYSSCKKVRNLISLMSQYAHKIELSSTNYAPLLTLGTNNPVRPHHVFTRQKINRLWNIADEPNVDTVLMLLYTGLRVGELLQLQIKDIHIRQGYFNVTRSKTKAGIRTVPIHHRIMPFFERRMSVSRAYLIEDKDGKPYDYSRYRETIWDKIMKQIHATHTPHDCRHTVATLLDNAGANENATRKLLGHSGGDVTDRVYTHKGLRQLRRCVELLK